MDIKLGTTYYVETDAVPKDANIVATTWQKVNKDGSPDRRFKQNKRVPVCEYGKILIQSESSLRVELMCSNSATILDMRYYANIVFS